MIIGYFDSVRLLIIFILKVSIRLFQFRNILCKKKHLFGHRKGLNLFQAKNHNTFVPMLHFANSLCQFFVLLHFWCYISFDKPFVNRVFLFLVRRVLVMEYMDGIPILNLGDEIAKRGINPGGKIAAAAKQ